MTLVRAGFAALGSSAPVHLDSPANLLPRSLPLGNLQELLWSSVRSPAAQVSNRARAKCRGHAAVRRQPRSARARSPVVILRRPSPRLRPHHRRHPDRPHQGARPEPFCRFSQTLPARNSRRVFTARVRDARSTTYLLGRHPVAGGFIFESGTEGSNPFSSSGESTANLTSGANPIDGRRGDDPERGLC
jgi:hypothetical protein